VALGSSSDLEETGLVAGVGDLRAHVGLSTLHWSDWEEVCENLDVAQHVALLKALTLAEKHAGWGGGSVSPIIWVYRALEPRVSYETAHALASWVIARSDNGFAPFGSTRLRGLFESGHVSEDTGGSISGQLTLQWNLDHMRRAEEHRQRVEQAATERIQRRAAIATAHAAGKIAGDARRTALLSQAAHVGATGQLELVARRDDVPVALFPASWADVSNAELDLLGDELRVLLAKRLASMRRGPWMRLRNRLLASATAVG
jgi:hypothetical protein